MVVNVYFLSTSFYKWLVSDNGLNKGSQVVIGMIGFGAMVAYLAAIGYLAFRTEKQVTYLLEPEDSIASNNRDRVANNEVELHGPFGLLPRDDLVSMQLPQNAYRPGDL
jgi:hypothetical protein